MNTLKSNRFPDNLFQKRAILKANVNRDLSIEK